MDTCYKLCQEKKSCIIFQSNLTVLVDYCRLNAHVWKKNDLSGYLCFFPFLLSHQFMWGFFLLFIFFWGVMSFCIGVQAKENIVLLISCLYHSVLYFQSDTRHIKTFCNVTTWKELPVWINDSRLHYIFPTAKCIL